MTTRVLPGGIETPAWALAILTPVNHENSESAGAGLRTNSLNRDDGPAVLGATLLGEWPANSTPRAGRARMSAMDDNPYQTDDDDEARAKRFERGAVRFAKFAFYFLIFVVLAFAGIAALLLTLLPNA